MNGIIYDLPEMPNAVHVALTDQSQSEAFVHNFECLICFDRNRAIQLASEFFRRYDDSKEWIISLTFNYTLNAAGFVVTSCRRQDHAFGEVENVLEGHCADRHATS